MSDTLSELLVKLDADSADFRSSIDKALTKLDDLENKVDSAVDKSSATLDGIAAHTGVIAGLTEVAVTTLEAYIEKIGELPIYAFEKLSEVILDAATAQDAVYTSAQRLGASTEIISSLGFAAKEVGSSSEAMEKALFKLGVTSDKGSKEWEHWGISARNSAGEIKGNLELFDDLLSKYDSLGSETERAALLTAAFGKSARELTPLIKELADGGIDHAMEEAARFHQVISDADATLGHQFNVSLGRTKDAFEGLTREVATAFEPTLIAAFDAVSVAIANEADQIEDNRTLMRRFVREGAVKTIDAIEGLVIAVGALETKFAILGKAWKVLSTINDYSPIGMMANEMKALGEDVKFAVDQSGVMDEANKEQADSTKALIDQLEKVKLAIRDAADADDDYSDGSVINAAKRRGTAGQTTGEAAKALRDAKILDDFEQEAERAKAELKKLAQDEVKRTGEIAIKQEKNIFEEYRKRLAEQDKDNKLTDERQTQQMNVQIASAKKLATTIGDTVMGATDQLITSLQKGSNVLQDMEKYAEDLIIKLGEAALKAAFIFAIESALGGATGGVGGAFLSAIGVSSGAASGIGAGGAALSAAPIGSSGSALSSTSHVTVVAPVQSLIPDVTMIQSHVQRVLVPALTQILQTGQGDRIFKKHVQRWAG